MVLGGQQGHHGLAVDEAEQRHLRPVEEALQQDGVAALEALGRVIAGDVTVRGDDDALARGQTVVLDDPGRAEPVECGVEPGRVVDDLGMGGRDPRGLHDVLGEGLRPLDLRGLGTRTEGRDAGRAQGVGDPEDQGHLGTDDHEVGADLACQRDDRVAGDGVDGMVRGDRRGAGVARGDVQVGDRRIVRQTDEEGMFAAARADHEYAHVHDSKRRYP